MNAHLNQPPPLPSTLRADIPRPLEQLILEALAKTPEQRPPSCQAFSERLHAVLNTQ